jgi:hypothetical protein
VSITRQRNADAPAATSGRVDPGAAGAAQTAVFAVSTNRAGRTAFAETRDGPLTDSRDVSLIESIFGYIADAEFVVTDVNVSYE